MPGTHKTVGLVNALSSTGNVPDKLFVVSHLRCCPTTRPTTHDHRDIVMSYKPERRRGTCVHDYCWGDVAHDDVGTHSSVRSVQALRALGIVAVKSCWYRTIFVHEQLAPV